MTYIIGVSVIVSFAPFVGEGIGGEEPPRTADDMSPRLSNEDRHVDEKRLLQRGASQHQMRPSTDVNTDSAYI